MAWRFNPFTETMDYYEEAPIRFQDTTPELLPGTTITFTHPSDTDYKRLVEVLSVIENINADLDFDLVDRTKFFEENILKTDFVDGKVQLKGDISSDVYVYYKLNESSGTFVSDSSGNGRNGNTINNPSWVAGKLNNCIEFNGALSQMVDSGAIASFERTEPKSYEFWFNTTITTLRSIIVKYSSTQVKGFLCELTGGNIIFRLYSSGTKHLDIQTVTSWANGLWHHCVITYDGTSYASGVKIYIDGISQSLTTISDTLDSTIINTNPLLIGSRGTSAHYYGKLDEILIWGKVLTQSEVSYRYNAGTGREMALFDITKGWYVRTNTNQINTSGWTGISNIEVGEEIPASTQIKYLVSVDGRTIWKKWNGSAWVTVILANIDTDGNTKTELEAITQTQWDLLFIAGTFDIVMSLKTIDEYKTPKLDQITIKYLTPGYTIQTISVKIGLINATQTSVENIGATKLNDLLVNILI